MAQSNLFDQINIRGLIDGWARFTIEKWQAELRRKRIGVTDDLYKSFTKEVKRRGAEYAEIALKFNFYGRFVDMGVGNGLKSHERSTNNTARRDARRYGVSTRAVGRNKKPWLNKIKTAQAYRLSEILGKRSSEAIVRDFNNQNNVTVIING